MCDPYLNGETHDKNKHSILYSSQVELDIPL